MHCVAILVGKTSTHAVVMAQLYTKGVCHGIHAFVVQLRSLDDHRSLPGMTFAICSLLLYAVYSMVVYTSEILKIGFVSNGVHNISLY